MTQKRFKIAVGYVFDIRVFVARGYIICRFFARYVQHARKHYLVRVLGDADVIIGFLNCPSVACGIKVTEGFIIERNGYTLALACGKEYFCKSLELFLGAVNAIAFIGNVQLYNLCAITVTRVGNGNADTVLVNFDVAICKRGVAETVAKGIAYGNVGTFKVTVANKEPLAVFCGAFLAREVGSGRNVIERERPGFVQLTRGVNLAKQSIRHSARACLTAKVAVNSRAVGSCLGHYKGSAARENENNVFICLANRFDKRLLRTAQFHVQAVHALGFEDFVKTYAQKNRVSTLCNINRLCDEGSIGCRLATVKALRVSNNFNTCFGKAIIEVIEFSGVDLRRACALIARCLCKVTNNGNLCVCRQGKNAVIL